jgi:hypothetical protein
MSREPGMAGRGLMEKAGETNSMSAEAAAAVAGAVCRLAEVA